MDTVDKATRSRIMRAIKSRNTRPERRLAEELGLLGVYSVRHADLPGSPDFTVGLNRLAVFVHGCFWHCCPRHFRAPRTRAAHWRRHFAGNRRRDARVRRRLNRMGWRTMVVWEHEDMERAARRVLARSRGSR